MSERFHTHVPGLPDAPRWLSVAVPALVYPVLILLIFAYRPLYTVMMRKEGGIEYLAVLILLAGTVYGVKLLIGYRDRLPHSWLAWWYGLGTLAAFVLAGEELSWGQHLGLWGREHLSERWKMLNDQQETNFHNLTNALDQGPTNLVVASTLVAYVLLPLYQRWRRETMATDNPGYWFWPTSAGLIAALGVLLIPFPKRIYEWTTGQEGPVLMRHSEVHEFYIGLLIAIYLISAFYRARAMPPRSVGVGPSPTPS